MVSSLKQLDAFHLDLICEVANIGAGHAATSLSQMLNHRIDMAVPNVTIASFSDILNVDDADTPVAAIYLKVNGALTGHLFIMFHLDDLGTLMKPVLKDDGFQSDHLMENSLYVSVLGEIGNIMAGSYISALSDFSGENSFLSPPIVCVDMKSAILSEGLLDLSMYDDSAMVINAVLTSGWTQKNINSAFTFLPEPQHLSAFIHLLEKTNG